jgi:mono/diheme cytochrome c family protein
MRLPTVSLLRRLLPMLLVASVIGPATPARALDIAAVDTPEILKRGELIYREGLLPSGKPLVAKLAGNLASKGSEVRCASCHLRSGLGSLEGSIVTLPINGKSLFVPYSGFPKVGREGGMDEENQVQRMARYLMRRYGGPPSRPAYDDASLARAIREGKDPAGRVLDPLMPRFDLSDVDMAALTAYLKSLSGQYSPGVTATDMHVATVITDEVPAAERDRMLAKLDEFVQLHNVMAPRALSNFRRLSLARWVLHGPPEAWPAQLEEYNRKEPVFALLGGISTQDWRPIHEFSEQHQLPTLFPVTDLPVVADSGHYTFYFSKGYYQEGEAAATYLARQQKAAPDAPIIQVYQDNPKGRAFASGLRQAQLDLGGTGVIDVKLAASEVVSGATLQELADSHPTSPVVLWLGPEVLPAMTSLKRAATVPRRYFLSASLLGSQLFALPDALRESTLITYPYWLPQPANMAFKYRRARYGDIPGQQTRYELVDQQAEYKMYTMKLILGDVLSRIRSNFYQDYLVDLVSMIPVGPPMGISDDSPFEHISFGIGQRYAAKGCNIVQITAGPYPTLQRMADWVIQ